MGNRMNDDGSVSESTKERLEFLKSYYTAEKPDFVILSGGIANPKAGISEARAMLNELHGAIDESRIVLEDRSRTTIENAKFSAPLIASLSADEVTVISSPSHIRRIYMNPIRLFKKYLKRAGKGDAEIKSYCGRQA